MDTNMNYQLPEEELLSCEIIRDAKRAFSRCHLGASVYNIVAVAVMLIVEVVIIIALGIDKSKAVFNSPYFIWTMQVICMYVVAYPVFLLFVRKLPKAKRKKKPMSLEEFVVVFLISEGAMISFALVSNLFLELLSSLLGYPIGDTTSDMIMDTPIWVVVLVAVIIGPIIEELVFRKAFIDVLSRYGDRVAIIFSAVAFGLFHGNFSQVFYATAIGLIFGYVYTKTSNILYTILLHILINFMGTVPSLLVTDSMDRILNMTEETVFELSMLSDIMLIYGVAIVQYTLAIAGVALFIYVTKNRLYKVPNSCEIQIPKRSYLSTILCNPGVILFIIITILQFGSSILPPHIFN